MNKYILVAFAFVFFIFISDNVSAGSNGDAPQEGQDWIITQDTHVWDESISVKNIIVNVGSGLKLENVDLTAVGQIQIRADSQWINSTIYHDKETLDDNISLYNELELINTNLTMNATDEYDGTNSNVFFVSKDARLIIRDYDGDKNTLDDQSFVRGDNSHVTNESLVNSHSVTIGGCVSSACNNQVGDIDISNIVVENSFFENIYALRIYGNDTYIRNSTFNNSGFIVSTGDNTVFTNNTMTNSWTFWELVIPYGENALIAGNSLNNGSAGFGLYNSDNNIVRDNVCNNYVGYCLRLDNTNNTLVSNNFFSNKTSYASLIIDQGNNNVIEENIFFNTSGGDDTVRINGNFNTVRDNYFEKCGYNGNWYNTCIELCPYCFGHTSVILMNNITNNKFVNSSSGITLLSNVEYTNVIGNQFLGPEISRPNLAGIFPLRYPATYGGNYTKAPSNNTFENNFITNVGIGISFDFYGSPFGPGGYGNIVRNNTITNVDIGIQVWSLYENLTIHNNTINSTDYGSSFFDSSGRAGIYLKSSSTTPNLVNMTITNNTVHSDVGIGLITDYVDGLHVKYNEITTYSASNAFGNGIMSRNSIDIIIANNVIVTNISEDSAAAGIFVYSGIDINISNNSITSAVGIEISTYSQSTNYIDVTHNTIQSVGYGIISNGSFANLANNRIIGICNFSYCDVVNFEEVSKYGIFSSESTVLISDNEVTKYYELFASYISNYNVTNNTFNFGHIGIKSNNSEGSLYLNNFTNITTINSLHKSSLTIIANDYKNFDKGIYSFNSTVNFKQNTMQNGDLCSEFIDSDYLESLNTFNCRDNNILVSYTIAVRIANENDEGSYNHPFQIYNSQGELIISDNTRIGGDAGYYILQVYKLNSDEVSIFYNPFELHYTNNDILVEYKRNITYNQTLLGILDTTPPVSVLTGFGNLLNGNTIELNINVLDNSDFKEYQIEYLVNDEFAEWEVYGTFTNGSTTFYGLDSKEYRFRSIAYDIYGNKEVKTFYEYQVTIDTSVPKTEILEFDNDYYFIGRSDVKISWKTDFDDVKFTNIEIFYTNFTTPYLNSASVTWTLVENFIVEDNNEFNYDLSSKGHYAFIIKSTDYAGNQEIKNDFDVVFNYNSKVDTLIFGDVPNRWGSSELGIPYETSSFNLDFNLYIALESISADNDYLAWYSYDYEDEGDVLNLRGLQDNTRYYFYAVSRDLAGNVEDPLNTTSYYSSNGLYDQKFELKYIPLLDWEYNFIVEIDNDLDGTYETVLSRGLDYDRLKQDEYFIDVEDNKIIFGGVANGGFVPSEDINGRDNIKISYSGVHAVFEIYTGQPESASSINIVPSNTTEVIVSFYVPKDAATCKVQRSTNLSNGFFNQEIIEPCVAGINEYVHYNPDLEEEYFYRIMIVDEFGHESFSENRSLDMKDVVKLYSTAETSEQGLFGMDSIIPLTALIGIVMLGFGGVLLYRSKNEEIIDENVSVIESKPVAKYKVEELYLIYKDGRLVSNISDVEVKTDSDIMSGMLTAINDFVQDSFNTEGDLGSIDYGNNKIVLQRGTHSYLAAVIYGETDNQFKGKMINAVRNIEKVNPTMDAWNGDAETILHTGHYLQPIIDETKDSTKVMVDNYFSEKEIVLTTSYEKSDEFIDVQVHLSNYSSRGISNCKLVNEYNSLNLSLLGIEPDVLYSFSDNSFIIGELDSYNEVTFKLKFQIKASGATPLEIKMFYEQKGRKGSTNSTLEII